MHRHSSNVVLDRYWDNPDATTEALANGWFHTGDGGTIDDEGHLTISDRKKDVIITGGENVSSIEVEDCISHLPGVAEVAVIGQGFQGALGQRVDGMKRLTPDSTWWHRLPH